MEVAFPFIFIIFIVLAVVLGILAWQQQKRRREALSVLGRSMGLRFFPGRDESMEHRYPEFSCLRDGSNRYAYNILQGTWEGRGVCAFDYHYETYSSSKHGRQTHHHHFSAAVVESGLPLRPLVIRPENIFDKLGEFLGFDDIDFESSEFSRRFSVRSPDRRWAYDVIQQATMEFLLQSPVFHLEFGGQRILARKHQTFRPGEFKVALQVIRGILDRLPEYLLREMEGRR